MFFKRRKQKVSNDNPTKTNQPKKKEIVNNINLNELIEKAKLNSIDIKLDFNNEGSIPKGSSKIGGNPDLPKDFDWYYFEAEGFSDEVVKHRPLSFLAQFNCEELHEYDIENRLPQKGMLYFFYELDSMKWGFDPKDRGCAKVFYYDGDINKLQSTIPPEDLNEEYIIPEIKLKFNPKYNAPDFEEMFDYSDIKLWDEYDKILEDKKYSSDEFSSKLLGYSDSVQGDMTLECQLVSNGLYCGDSTGYESNQRKELEKNKHQWKLLFQLDTIEIDDYELMFGDCGMIYFYIKVEDLKNKNFDNIWLILQCT